MWTWDRKDSDVTVWGTRVTPKGCDMGKGESRSKWESEINVERNVVIYGDGKGRPVNQLDKKE